VFDIINPIRRTSSPEAAAHYLREPYVLRGDVSGGAFAGKGGWTWYTGAAGWAWQLAVHGLLGIEFMPDAIRIAPCLPHNWARAEIQVSGPLGDILLSIKNANEIGTGTVEITVDGAPLSGATVRFPGAGKSTRARVRIVRKE
jgi:cyclic beta-1,2-glucan synthetase